MSQDGPLDWSPESSEPASDGATMLEHSVGTFGDRYPWLRELADQPVGVLGHAVEGGMPARVRNTLGRGQVLTCGNLAELTERDILDVRNSGRGSVDQLLAVLESAGSQLLEGRQHVESASVIVTARHATATELLRTVLAESDPIKGIREPLELLATWARFSNADGTVGGVIDSLAGSDAIPEDVQRALESVRNFQLPSSAPETGSLLSQWLEQLDSRERDIVSHRIASQDRTLDEIGLAYAVTRERIRQLEHQLRADLVAQFALDDWREVRWSVSQLEEDGGSWARVDRLPTAAPDDVGWRLLTVLADLALGADDLTIQRRGFRLPELDDLVFVAPEGVILEADHAREALTDIGVTEIHQDDAFEAIGLRHVDGSWVRWPRSHVERGIALLATSGVPMTAEDLAAGTGANSSRSMSQRLREDRRVQRVTRLTLGLRSWGLPEYTGVVDLMLKVIADRGGVVLISDLTAHLEEVYQVKPATVMAYSVAPAFVVEDTVIRARGRSEHYPVDADPSRVPGLSITQDSRTRFEIVVDGELLRGSGRAAPVALGVLMGLQPGRSLEFETADDAEQTTVTLTWSRASHVGPHLGSLRALALAHSAVTGDRLGLTFDPTTLTVEHELVRHEVD